MGDQVNGRGHERARHGLPRDHPGRRARGDPAAHRRREPEHERPPDEHRRAASLDAHLHLLDRQVLDRDGVPVTTVDDLELDGDRAATPTPAPRRRRDRDPHRAGARSPGSSAVDPPPSRRTRIPWSDVGHVGITVELGVPATPSTRRGSSAGSATTSSAASPGACTTRRRQSDPRRSARRSRARSRR